MASAASTLQLVNGIITIGESLIPVIKGVVTDIKAIMTPQGTVQYTVVISTDQQELVSVQQVAASDLQAINKELAAQGAPAMAVPAPEPAEPTVTVTGT